MWQILRQIVRTGIVTEPPPALDAAVKDEVRRIHEIGRASCRERVSSPV